MDTKTSGPVKTPVRVKGRPKRRRRRAYDPIQTLFLARLDRMLQLWGEPRLRRWQRILLDKAIYSTYLDCAALGLTSEAQRLLRKKGRRAAQESTGGEIVDR
jgi:hypothetical protein